MEENHSTRVLRFLPFAALGLLIALWMAAPLRVRADGGGLPTRTPTRTLIPLAPAATATSPQLQITFPPTGTHTPVAGALGQQPPPNQAIPEAGTTAAARPFSLLSCWPFVLVVLLVLVVGVMWLSGRRQSTV
jgi:hypothetical protein